MSEKRSLIVFEHYREGEQRPAGLKRRAEVSRDLQHRVGLEMQKDLTGAVRFAK